ncbi:MAG: CoA transferase [Dehalococcoidia bacterium]|nr:CoA transferase [Dehalococcoidia bacterium]
MSSYRVLDLTHGGCLIAGRVLGDLGADVIQIEPPGGNPSRNIGPFYEDDPHSEKSLFWFAYAANKRGVTLDVATRDGRDIFKKLAASADFVIESFPPGYMESLGLGYDTLSKINPRVILTSITPFGQTGPKAHHEASDLTAWAAGGQLYASGEPDRPPNWISYPQAYLQAGVEAASASLIAHWHTEMSGEGQQVDVSVQECVVGLLMNAVQFWDMNRITVRRIGYRLPSPRLSMGLGYACKDGWVSSYVLGGSALGFTPHMRELVKWLEEEGMAPEWLKDFDWVNEMDASKLTQEKYDRIEEPFVRFFKTKTKQELLDRALRGKHVLIGPVQTPGDIAEDRQLRERDFWVDVEHPELNAELKYCGPFAKLGETPCEIRRRAPLIGEHNEDIYCQELGFSRKDLVVLKQARVI